MDNNDFTPGRDRSANINPARARILGRSGMTAYTEDWLRRTYKDLVPMMFGDEEPDDEGRRIAVQQVTDMLNNKSRMAKTGGSTPFTTEQVDKVVERLRLRDNTPKPTKAVQIIVDAYDLIEEEHIASGDSRTAIASRYILAGHAAMVQAMYGDAEDGPLH
jgi:hypothetical protein